MGKDIGQIYKYSQSQLSTLSLRHLLVHPQIRITKIPSIMMQESQIIQNGNIMRKQYHNKIEIRKYTKNKYYDVCHFFL